MRKSYEVSDDGWLGTGCRLYVVGDRERDTHKFSLVAPRVCERGEGK
jgi:hypothetical protein